MENKKDKKKLFLPMLISVVITILICLFSKLFVEDFREVVNYIFLVLIYIEHVFQNNRSRIKPL